MRAMRDTQSAKGRFTDVAPVGGGFGGVLWGSAGITVAWETYRQYGDTGVLEEHYPAMAAYIDYLESTINAKTGLSSDAALGDWLGPQNNLLGSAFLATAYHAYDLGIMALVAQQEREAISRRTKEALAVAKARGVRLGNPNGIEAIRQADKGGAPLRKAIARNAERRAQDLAPVVHDIQAGGATSRGPRRSRPSWQ